MQDPSSTLLRSRLGWCAAAVALVALVALVGPSARGTATQDSGPPGFPDLVGGLEATEGCIGVETAQASDGKQLIFAWFEDKAAARRWYYSEMHQGVMDQFFPDRGDSKPLAHVPDKIGPILAIASITMDEEARFDETSLPISQISIELYTPITGGISLGGTFAPKDLVIPKRKVVIDDE